MAKEEDTDLQALREEVKTSTPKQLLDKLILFSRLRGGCEKTLQYNSKIAGLLLEKDRDDSEISNRLKERVELVTRAIMIVKNELLKRIGKVP